MPLSRNPLSVCPLPVLSLGACDVQHAAGNTRSYCRCASPSLFSLPLHVRDVYYAATHSLT